MELLHTPQVGFDVSAPTTGSNPNNDNLSITGRTGQRERETIYTYIHVCIMIIIVIVVNYHYYSSYCHLYYCIMCVYMLYIERERRREIPSRMFGVEYVCIKWSGRAFFLSGGTLGFSGHFEVTFVDPVAISAAAMRSTAQPTSEPDDAGTYY